MSDPRSGTIETKEEQEKDNVVHIFEPKVIQGGKGPSDPSDWLSKLPIGSTFLTKKGKEPVLMEWKVENKTEKAVWLTMIMPDGQVITQPVDPKEFCSIFAEFEILSEGPVTAIYE